MERGLASGKMALALLFDLKRMRSIGETIKRRFK